MPMIAAPATAPATAPSTLLSSLEDAEDDDDFADDDDDDDDDDAARSAVADVDVTPCSLDVNGAGGGGNARDDVEDVRDDVEDARVSGEACASTATNEANVTASNATVKSFMRSS
jgi:hypothetical protein